jgi:hypothetical protein
MRRSNVYSGAETTMGSTKGFGRIGTASMWPLAALALQFAGAIAEPAGADEEFKTKFKAGCESSGGSWVENPDGSYQCNARSGEVTKCFPEDPPRCIHTPS